MSGLSFITSTANELVLQHGRNDFHVVAVCRDQSQLQAYLDLLPSRSKGTYRLSTHSTGLSIASDSAAEHLLSRIEEIDEEKQENTLPASGGCCSSRAKTANRLNEESEIGLAGAQSIPLDQGPDDEKMRSVDVEAIPPKGLKVKDIKAARPDLKGIIREEARNAQGSRLAIVACGPDSFMRDVQDEVALLQMDILKGRSKVNEIYLRSEAFHW